MSTVPEVILARFLGLRVLAFSVITNYGAGMTGAELSHAETKEVAPLRRREARDDPDAAPRRMASRRAGGQAA